MTIKITTEKEVYYAGETIIGKVELNKEESVQINNNVTICIHGFAEVYGNLGTSESRTEYINKSSVLVVKSWKDAVYSGNFSMPFHFDLPSDLPSTFNHPYCKIIYYLDLVFDKVAEIKPKTQKQFIVLNKVDLNHHFDLKAPFTANGSIKHPFEYSLTTNRRAYLAGDTIKMKATITNNSQSDIDYIPICLIESVVTWSKSSKGVEHNRVVARTSFPTRVKSGSTVSGEARMRVPALWPSSNGRCSIIEVTYYVVVATKPADVASKSLAKPFPIDARSFDKESRITIVIGTVAYKDDMMEAEPPDYADLNADDEELPVYEAYAFDRRTSRSISVGAVNVELESKRLTLPAAVPELTTNWGSVSSAVGSLFGY